MSWKVAIVTVSDRCSLGEREDLTGAKLKSLLQEEGYRIIDLRIVPDERDRISEVLRELCDTVGCDLVITNGGTGVSPRDVTPEATKDVIDREIPGMAEAMRAESLRKTPYAMLSRAIVGVRGKSLIINLPGSPSGAVENFMAIRVSIPHALEKIQGDPSECSRD
ncbi:MAG: MogA/MoaB family molybdenum cofactor biosynthesis protein [Syntrophobacterales bacterium]|nr:MogA/MoaB family molybdenum cofactor biosynthesis protein [Syntrophobacterales bacterium]